MLLHVWSLAVRILWRSYKNKRAKDISGYSYVTHNGAYIAFIIYLYGSGRGDDSILMFYYLMGIRCVMGERKREGGRERGRGGG